MLIHDLVYDKPLLSGQPSLNGHLLVSQQWPLIGGSTQRVLTAIQITSTRVHKQFNNSVCVRKLPRNWQAFLRKNLFYFIWS